MTLTKTDCSTSIYQCLCWTENTFRKIVTHQFISVFAELLNWSDLVKDCLWHIHSSVSLLNWSNLQKDWLQHLHLSPPKLLHWRGPLQKDQLGHIHLSVFAELKCDLLQKDWLGHWDSVSLSVVNSVCLSVVNILRDSGQTLHVPPTVSPLQVTTLRAIIPEENPLRVLFTQQFYCGLSLFGQTL